MNTPQRSNTPSGDFRSRVDGIRRTISNTPSQRTAHGPLGGDANVSIAQEHRLARLVDVIGGLEKQLAAESNTRLKTTQALLNTFDTRLQEAVQQLEAQYQERVVKMNIAVDHMTSRIAELEDEVASERDKNARLTRELMGRNTSDIDELRDRLGAEREAREGAIQALVAKVSSELDRFNERLDAEHVLRDRACRDLHSMVGEASSMRHASDERLLAKIRGDIARLVSGLDQEKQEREVGEEGLAATLEAIVQSL